MQILIVDDSDMMRRVLKLAFEQNMEATNYGFVDARDGGEAWKLLSDRTPIDLMFVDWNMPVLNGVDLVKRMRSSGLETPVIMVSSVSDETMIHEAFAAGVNVYLNKPVRVSDVWENVQEYLR